MFNEWLNPAAWADECLDPKPWIEPLQAQQAVEVGDANEEVEDRQGSLSSRRPKTPRCDGGLSPGPSPNARSRKMRKGAREKDEEEGQALHLQLACMASAFKADPAACGGLALMNPAPV